MDQVASAPIVAAQGTPRAQHTPASAASRWDRLSFGVTALVVLFIPWDGIRLGGGSVVNAFLILAFAATFVLWLGPAIHIDILKPYQRARITGFTNPSPDPGGPTYNLDQSIADVVAVVAQDRGGAASGEGADLPGRSAVERVADAGEIPQV